MFDAGLRQAQLQIAKAQFTQATERVPSHATPTGVFLSGRRNSSAHSPRDGASNDRAAHAPTGGRNWPDARAGRRLDRGARAVCETGRCPLSRGIAREVFPRGTNNAICRALRGKFSAIVARFRLIIYDCELALGIELGVRELKTTL